MQRTRIPNLRLSLQLSIYSTGLQQQFTESSSGFPFGGARRATESSDAKKNLAYCFISSDCKGI